MLAAGAQRPDPAYQPLEKAYEALRAKNYDDAISSFERAIALAPQRASIHKDLAYTLLKVGSNDAALDQFAAAMRLDPADQHVALDMRFSATRPNSRSPRGASSTVFAKTATPRPRPLSRISTNPWHDGIARWQKLSKCRQTISAGMKSSPNWPSSAMSYLSRPAEHYEKAWRIKPEERSLLLDLGRFWKLLGRQEDATAALLAASRSTQPRVSERARELLPSRYPYVYEFQNAIRLDPKNVELRHELAYLELEMGNKQEAEAQFKAIHQLAPDD